MSKGTLVLLQPERKGDRWRRDLALAALLFVVQLAGTVGPVWGQACASGHPSWIFCTGFEEGNLDLWDDYDGNPPATNTLLSDPGPFNEPGNHVVRLRAPAGTGGADLIKVLPPGYDRLYARWYVKWEPGYDFTARNHGSGLFAGDRNALGAGSGDRPDGTDEILALLEPNIRVGRLNLYVYYPGMYQDCADPVGNCWGDNFPCLNDDGAVFCTNPDHRPGPWPPVLETGRWYCLEMLLDCGSPTPSAAGASGVLNLWIDGVEYGPWENLWLRTTPDLKLNLLWINLWHHAEHSVEGIMVDEVVVSTARIGPGPVPTEAQSWGTIKSGYR